MKVRLKAIPYGLRLLLATVIGIGTGGQNCLSYLLEGVQELAFGQAGSDLLQQFQEAGGLGRISGFVCDWVGSGWPGMFCKDIIDPVNSPAN